MPEPETKPESTNTVIILKKRAPRPPKEKKEAVKKETPKLNIQESDGEPLKPADYVDLEALELKRCEATGAAPEVQTISDLVSLPPDVKVNVVKVDQRTETARAGRAVRVPKPGKPGAPKPSEVTSDDLKDKDPMKVRDQLVREYYLLRNQMDECVQKLCVLVFKVNK